MVDSSRKLRLVRSRTRQGWREVLTLVPMLLVAAGVGGGAVLALRDSGVAAWLLDEPVAVTSSATQFVTRFSICGSAQRVTCVVDGDTIWLEGTKIRIADLNTPEISQPACAAEAVLGAKAKTRLTELLNAGPFEVRSSGNRDADQYGRKLRIIERDGRSLSDTMIAEGLAHAWRGKRESWC
jgi:endonuclease YncB( thermonuclease family)